jgi:mRNA interferase MazF
MRRGEIWTVAGGPHYAGKPRPVVILQADRFSGNRLRYRLSVYSHDIDGSLFRLPVYPTDQNGLMVPSWLMADKLVTVAARKLGSRVGRLDPVSLAELSRSIIVFLNLLDHGRGR